MFFVFLVNLAQTKFLIKPTEAGSFYKLIQTLGFFFEQSYPSRDSAPQKAFQTTQLLWGFTGRLMTDMPVTDRVLEIPFRHLRRSTCSRHCLLSMWPSSSVLQPSFVH